MVVSDLHLNQVVWRCNWRAACFVMLCARTTCGHPSIKVGTV